MNRVLVSLFSVLSLCSASSTQADIITTNWTVTLTFQHDYVAGQTVPITVPAIFNVVISFPNVVTSFEDYGTTTITRIGTSGETMISSPLSAFVGADPFGGGIDPSTFYTFPNVSDYPSSFFEQFATQGNTNHQSGSMSWSHHISLRANRSSPSQGGTGSADYVFSSQSLPAFLDDIKDSPGDFSITFNESWQIYDSSTSSYVDGTGWGGTATLASVSTVPEPSSFWLLGTITSCAFFWRNKHSAQAQI